MDESTASSGIGRGERGSRTALLLTLLLIALLVIFLILPIVLAVGTGFVHEQRFSLYWFRRVFLNPLLIRQLRNGFLLAATTTSLCLAIALPMALLRTCTRFTGQGALGVLVLVPLILPPFVGALAMRRIFGPFGVVNMMLERVGVLDFSVGLPPDWLGTGFAGVVLLQVLHLFPIMYLNASASLANVDPAYMEAARNLGGSPLQTFFKVTLPLMRPGLFAGGAIIFIWSFTDIGTPVMLQYDELAPVTIFKELARGEFGGRTYSLVFIVLSAALIFYVLGKFVLGRGSAGDSSKGSGMAEVRRLGVFGTIGAHLLFGAVIGLAILPHVGVVLTAVADSWVGTILPRSYTLRHMAHVVSSEATYRSIFNSLRYAGTATAIDLAAGTIIAWLLVRTRTPGRSVLDGLAMLPLAVPGLILAAGYVAMTVRGSPLEAIGPTGNPFAILVIAYSVRRLPFAVRGVAAGIDQVPVTLEEAARNLGAGRIQTSMRITFPLIAANLIAAGILTFAFAMLEVSDSLILAQVQSDYPITKQIYALAVSTGSPDTMHEAAALGVYGMCLLIVTMGLASALLGRRFGAVFRA